MTKSTNTTISVLADENIPGLETLIGDFSQIRYHPGRSINADDLEGIDALLVRSVTTVDEHLLSGWQPSFIGSCTIGTDHVDTRLLKQRGITFANAPGCNASAVVDYVIAALFERFSSLDVLQKKQVAIIGYGNVGSRLYHRLQASGVSCYRIDPFVDEAEDSMAILPECDVVTLHVPLTTSSQYATRHLFDKQSLGVLKNRCVLINTSRGKVIDNEVLQNAIDDKQLDVVLDVYEDEPQPTDQLLNKLFLATPHIAGYSLQGKLRGSQMVVEELLKHFQLEHSLKDCLSNTCVDITLNDNPGLLEIVRSAYDIRADSDAFLKSYLTVNVNERSRVFDAARKNYKVRTEWAYFTARCMVEEKAREDAIKLGFLGL